ncbi:iojap-like protein [Firmicutes bacterium CAG:124]|nr:iojap-like protein [Firmicutes bacterium CAG:124]
MLSAKEVAALAAKALDAKMGEDIRLIGITDISTLADFFLICTATSSTHVKTLCDAVEEAMDEAGEPMLSPEGRGRADALPRGPSRRHVGAHGLRQPCCARLYGGGQKVL